MTSDDDIRGRLESLLAIDEGLGQILESLERNGRLDDTVVVVAGDHGYFYGEHGLDAERRFAYEESARIPLVVRYPRAIKGGSSSKHLVVSVDLAPTILELAGVTPTDRLHGRSLVPLLKGLSVPWRTSVLIEYFTDRVFPRARHMGYKAVRTERFKYIQYADLEGMDELYDLDADPYELNNLLFYEPSTGYRVPSPAHRSTLEDMRGELSRLLTETDGAVPDTTQAPRSPQ
jgi:N-acetylglucosamine-6-sulfatase